MIKKLILIIIIGLLAISLYSFGSKKGGDGSEAEKASSKSTSVTEKDKLVEEEEKEKLKDFVMPTIDIVAQIGDSAKSVLRKETDPDIAISIYASAGNFLTKKRLELNDLKTPTDDMVIAKDRVLAIVDDCISELDVLTDITKSGDMAMMEGSVAIYIDKIEELRSIAGITDPKEENTD